MKRQLLGLGLSVGLAFSAIPAAVAVQPAPVQLNSKVQWSKVVDDPFDGTVVYDRHYTNDFAFVSSWSQQGIRATYTEFNSELVGYRTTWDTPSLCYGYGRRCRYRWFEPDPIREPIYRRWSTDRTPESILFAIHGQRYTYEAGPVSPELAAALASAPAGNMRIRLVWSDGGTTDVEIGKGTVAAWKTLFNRPSH